MQASVSTISEKPRIDFFGYLLYPFFLFAFLGTLLVFEPIQRLALAFGERTQQKAALWLSRFIVASLKVVGTKIKLEEPTPGFLDSLSADKAYILVSTHQSLFDISVLATIFARHLPRFVAKKELGRGIPSVSFNLRAGGAALIDRENPRQAIPELKRFGKHLVENKFAAVIFPEGTRARNGELKEMQAAGLTVLLNAAPEAEVIPLVLKGTWKLSSRKFGPVPRNVCVVVSILPKLERTPGDAKTLCATTLRKIEEHFPRC